MLDRFKLKKIWCAALFFLDVLFYIIHIDWISIVIRRKGKLAAASQYKLVVWSLDCLYIFCYGARVFDWHVFENKSNQTKFDAVVMMLKKEQPPSGLEDLVSFHFIVRPWRWWGFVCIDVWFKVGSWKHVKCFCKSVPVHDSAVFPTLRFRFPRNLLRWNLYRNEQFAFRFIPGLLWHMFHIFFYFEHAFGFRSPLPGFLHACALWSLSLPDFQSIQLWSLFV